MFDLLGFGEDIQQYFSLFLESTNADRDFNCCKQVWAKSLSWYDWLGKSNNFLRNRDDFDANLLITFNLDRHPHLSIEFRNLLRQLSFSEIDGMLLRMFSSWAATEI